MRPIVGVMPLWDEEKQSIWMLPGYVRALEEAGADPLIFPLTSNEDVIQDLCDRCRGFLLTGGQDVSPDLYHEERLCGVDTCRERDEMEGIVLDHALRENKAVLGICRGIQFINVYLGGTLYQDLDRQCPSKTCHHQAPPYDIPVHEVMIQKDSPLYEALGVERLFVNSYHHQAVRVLADELTEMARSEDGLVEAACLLDRPFVWGIQWHPEYAYQTDQKSRAIFCAFVRAMRISS